MATISRLFVSLTADPKGFKKGLGTAKTLLGNFKKNVFNVQNAIVGLVAGGAASAALVDLVKVNERFQKLKSSLQTVTGGAQQADQAFKLIENFATTTPFALEEVIGSFIKLKALGLDPSREALNSYGNTASAMGKSLDQMIEAVADASTGEFERLKEFGIRASTQGDQVAFTFQGITTTVQKNAAEIEGYLMSIGNNQFGSAMADQMNNMTPAFSNFGAALDGLKVAIGESGLNQAITDIVNNLTNMILNLDKDQIANFTKSIMLSVANFLEGVDSVYRYISGNSHLATMGLIGYAFFGKTGVGVAVLIDQVNTAAARNMAEIWESLNPSGITGAGAAALPSYQLGDFNRANPAEFGTWAENVRSAGDDQVSEQKTTNNLLQGIADSLRTNAGAIAQ